MIHSRLIKYISLLLLILTTAPSPALEYWVRPDAPEGGDGTPERPFHSMNQTLAAMRLVRADDEWPPESVTFHLHGGDYYLDEPFILRPEDGGTEAHPVSIQAVEGEHPRWVGGARITTWRSVQDPAILDRLPEKARTNVQVADLSAHGVTDFGTLKSRGFKRYGLQPAALELFVDGNPMTLARWPNEDFVTIAGFPPEAETKSRHGIPRGRLDAGFFYEDDRPSEWAKPEKVWMHGYWMWDWADTHEKIQSIDPQSKLIKTEAPHGFEGFRTGQRYYYYNILEELDAPGEWYLNRDTGKLYFWPPTPLDGADVLVSVVGDTLLQLRSTSHVTIRGIEFVAGRAQGISIQGGRYNTVENCTLKNLGTWAAEIAQGVGHRIVGCEVSNTGDGGIRATAGNRTTLEPGSLEITDNHIHHIGRWSRCYRQGINVQGVGNRVAHNLIHHLPHCAIAVKGNDHMIEFNEIHHACLETGDVGAIYMGRDYTWRGNVVRFNYIHHLGGVNMGSMGVYLDDMVSGFQVVGNVFAELKYGIYMGGGRDNLLANNAFYNCEHPIHVDGRGMDPQHNWRWMVNEPMRERYYAMDPLEAPYITRYPELRSIDPYFQDADAYIPPEGTVIQANIANRADWLHYNKPEQVEPFVKISDNFGEENPGFIAPENGNFHFSPDSPAWKTGFRKLPLEQIGPRTSK